MKNRYEVSFYVDTDLTIDEIDNILQSMEFGRDIKEELYRRYFIDNKREVDVFGTENKFKEYTLKEIKK